MSNVALFNPAQLPAFARSGELSDIAKALAGNGGGGGKPHPLPLVTLSRAVFRSRVVSSAR